jgi:hypothetical protein
MEKSECIQNVVLYNNNINNSRETPNSSKITMYVLMISDTVIELDQETVLSQNSTRCFVYDIPEK